MLFKKYKNYLKLKIVVNEYNRLNPTETVSLKSVIKSINNLSDDLEVNGVIDALNGIY